MSSLSCSCISFLIACDADGRWYGMNYRRPRPCLHGCRGQGRLGRPQAPLTAVGPTRFPLAPPLPSARLPTHPLSLTTRFTRHHRVPQHQRRVAWFERSYKDMLTAWVAWPSRSEAHGTAARPLKHSAHEVFLAVAAAPRGLRCA